MAEWPSAGSGLTETEVKALITALSQPIDSDLTAIAALSTTIYGRAFLVLANEAAARSALGLGTAATQPTGAFDAAGAAASAQAASQPLDSDLTAIAGLSTTAFGREFLELATAASGRSKLGLGSASTQASSAFDAAGEAATEKARAEAAEALKASSTDARFPKLAATSADQELTKENTVLQNLTGLGLEIGASSTEKWMVEWWLLVEAANTVMDLKVGFTVPAGCTMRWGGLAGGNAGAGVPAWTAAAPGNTPGVAVTAGEVTAYGTREGVAGVAINALVFGGGTGGSVQIRGSQNVSNAGALAILKGSALRAHKVAS